MTEVSRASARQTGSTDWARLEKAVGTLQSQLTAAKQQASTVELTALALQLQGAADALKVGLGLMTHLSTQERSCCAGVLLLPAAAAGLVQRLCLPSAWEVSLSAIWKGAAAAEA